MPRRTIHERALVILLRLAGAVTVTAFLAMLMPEDWMAATHAWLGLGEFPRAPIVDYLTRSIALLYGFHGVLLLLVSTDPIRYKPIVCYIGIMNVLFGSIVLVIDVRAGLPLHWSLAEGPPVTMFGFIVLYLFWHLPAGDVRAS